MPHDVTSNYASRRVSFLVLLTVSLGLLSLHDNLFKQLQPTAHAAATFTVNSTGDGADSNTADGVCKDAAGDCTLRAAIEEANATPGTDTINFSVTGTISLRGALPDLASDVTISGPGANLLNVRRSTADGTPHFRIFTIPSSVTVDISGLTVSGGLSPDNGGGILNRGGVLTLTNAAISGNASGRPYEGGGIFNEFGGTVTLTNCTVSGNTSSDGGGGISNLTGVVTLTNSTVSGNTAGIYAGAISNNGTLTLLNSTVSGNMSRDNGRAVYSFDGATVNIRNTIIAGNKAGSGSNPDLGGSFNSQDYNLIGDAFGVRFTGVTTHNVTGRDPKLLPLGDYGGPTETQLPRPSSPAIDAGDDSVLSSPPGPTTDQRGTARKVGAHVDIGAVEFDPGADTIDATPFFVRQHYRDFLGRAPDAAGLQFWTSEIEQCREDAQCREVKRVNVSAAFFLSIEFQETGYLVYRMYKASFGDIPGTPVPVRFQQFFTDTQEVGRGVIVNVGDWRAQLENNKQAFTLKFVQRPEFSAKYPTGLTPTQLVDALFANAGVAPSPADRQAGINEFGGAADTADVNARARALRDVAENATLKQQEFNKAFVLMEYFGYLRRNPDDPPDANLDGYNFWLNKLNQFNGNFIQAEMVKAFLDSVEYRNRFL